MLILVESFMNWLVNIEKKINIYMGNISAGSEYLPILRYQCIYKSRIRVSDTVGGQHVHGVIDGYSITNQG